MARKSAIGMLFAGLSLPLLKLAHAMPMQCINDFTRGIALALAIGTNARLRRLSAKLALRMAIGGRAPRDLKSSFSSP